MAWAEKNFEERMAPCIDRIYRRLFKNIRFIRRSNRDTKDTETMFMDKRLAIDTFIYFNDGSFITLQEKTRRSCYAKYDDFTFEYYNDPLTREPGEWFKLAAQWYFYGYANEAGNGYSKFYLIDVAKLRLYLKNTFSIETLEKNYMRRNPPPAKANFFAIPFSAIDNECFKYRYPYTAGVGGY